jgi:poly(3-hydroxybutyrate) depolymerase
MIRKKHIILILFVAVFGFSCGAGSKEKEVVDLETGKVLPQMKCSSDSSISYALYLPSNYDPAHKFPVIFAFDAHGNGSKPVELFSEMAERYGYIVIGSNNSKNGMPADETMRIYEVMLNEALGLFSIDQARVYTAGFSGGSRVASSIAIFKGGIAGVIGCSAGFPALGQPIQFKFDYIGFVGDEDMNYLEMLTLEDALQAAGYRHHLVVFDGTHDWPPKSIVPEAFIWLEANAMKDKKKTVDSTFIATNIDAWETQAESLEKTGKIYDAFNEYRMIVNFFDGLTNVEVQKNKVKSLASSTQVKEALLKKEEYQKLELSLQTRYTRALAEKDPAWWKAEVANLNDQAETIAEHDERSVYKRLLGYLSLASYSYSNASLQAGDLVQAERFIELYSIIDPTNNEHAYLAACLYTKQNLPDKAFASLNQAVELGFDDLSRFKSDTVLGRLSMDPRYSEIIQKLQK